jgi:hypothetical protein
MDASYDIFSVVGFGLSLVHGGKRVFVEFDERAHT